MPKGGRFWRSKSDFFKPFQSDSAGENIKALYDPSLALGPALNAEEPDLKDLNSSLSALVDVFPDVQPEVFREMLLNLSDESRLMVVTEHLLKSKAKWVRGRYSIVVNDERRKAYKYRDPSARPQEGVALPVEERFRSETYKKAVKQVFYKEFSSLNHSTIRAVLAEFNYSYIEARPTLQHLTGKSWRFSISSIWAKKRSPSAISAGDHPNIIWQTEGLSGAGRAVPAVKRTGSAELDEELYQAFVAPIVKKQKEALLSEDYAVASKLNEAEAEEAEALYDCECCYTSSPFEEISTCDEGCHYLCFRCIRRTVNEALYGQGWARSIDPDKVTLRCLAPTSEECQGRVPPDTVRRALATESTDEELWRELQQRAGNEALLKSRLPLLRCPFCSYAEVDEAPPPAFRDLSGIRTHLMTRTAGSIFLQATLLLSLIAVILCPLPVLALVSLLWLLPQISPPFRGFIAASQARIQRRRRGLKFRCRAPSCARTSCTTCLASWRDPHVCFESQKTSLRTAIETSATAAIKRTCPKCLLSFVKASGCNKLVCNCGYTMCYVCRQEIGKEGYSHFCQHFRPSGGRCGECERCDLYGDEDEDRAIRSAVEEAEKTWREKEGAGEVSERQEQESKAAVEALIGRRRNTRSVFEGWVDAMMEVLLI